MRSRQSRSRQSRSRLKFSSPQQSQMLLAVLLTHLAFMGSPFHARTMSGGSHGIEMTDMPVGRGSLAVEQWPLRNSLSGHCIIEWLTMNQRMPQAMLLDAGGAATLLVSGLLAFGSPPIARALGPSSAGDQQALLQVFRE